MANTDRYQHTLNVFVAYETSLSSALKWMYETFKNTLKKDLTEAEDSVLKVAKQLRQIRVEYIQTRASNKLYLPDQSAVS